MLDNRAVGAVSGNCIGLELTKQRARIALTEALAKAPQDEVINSIVDTSIRTEDNLATVCNIAKVLMVNHSLIIECLALECMDGLIDCLKFQGALLAAITNTTPSDAFAHINHEVLSNVQGQ
jgi:hypothetical protein